MATERLTARQKGTIEEATAHMITVRDKLARVDGILRSIAAPTDLELQALQDLTEARIAARAAREIMKILRNGGVVP